MPDLSFRNDGASLAASRQHRQQQQSLEEAANSSNIPKELSGAFTCKPTQM
jgi:hypothetical protein